MRQNLSELPAVTLCDKGRELSARLAFLERGVEQVVRASVHSYKTEDEADELVATVADLQGAGAAG